MNWIVKTHYKALNYRLLVILLLGSSLCAISQPLHEAVGATGGQFTSPYELVDFTIGETIIDFHANENNDIQATQGFQQPSFSVSELKTKSICNSEIRLWPNPTVRYINIEIGKNVEIENVVCLLFHINGRIIGEYKIEEGNSLDLEKYQLNTLVIKLFDKKNKCSKTFKVVRS